MKRKFAPLIALATATTLVLAGCAGGSADSANSPDPSAPSAPSADDLIPVTVGVIPSIDVAAIYLGKAEGFFEEEGLDVTLDQAQGGAAIVPAVVSGEYEFGFSNITSLLLAADRGVPLQAVASGPFAVGLEEDALALVVPGDSAVQSPADLEGHTVAVNALANFTETVTRHSVDADGGDSSNVNFVEVAIPETAAALASGQVDAAFVGGATMVTVLDQGARVIAYPVAQVDPDLMISAYFTSSDFAERNPEVVEAFVRAMNRTNDFAEENPDATRAILSEFLRFDEQLQEKIVLPRFSSEFSIDSFQAHADLALEYGLVPEPIDFSALVP